MKPYVRYGLILGGALASITLIMYALGIEKDETFQRIFSVLLVLLVSAIIYMGIREKRQLGNGFITFGSGFSAGLGIALIGGAINIIMKYIYYKVIDPGMITYIRMKQEEDLLERGFSDADVERMAEKMQFTSTPEMLVGIEFFGIVVLGLVVSLICAGILKKEDPSEIIS
ncbi:MAG: DUF4199 domain-containing protein [Bacteroidota bacterium]|nr:DUF4199 domain-containing protein [Bacteroidota bacterium]